MTIGLKDELLHAIHDFQSHNTSTLHKWGGKLHVGWVRFYVQLQLQLQRRPLKIDLNWTLMLILKLKLKLN